MYRTLLLLLIFANVHSLIAVGQKYDPNVIEIGSTVFDGNRFQYVNMNRSGKRVKAKYFAAEDYVGNSVYERYLVWSKGRDIICITSGTYMDNCDNSYGRNNPVGLTIDNGNIVNAKYEDSFDGLVIVYATGGIAVSNIEDKNLSVDCSGTRKTFDVSSSYMRSQFIDCAKEVSATVFQTHLLLFKNEFQVYINGSSTQRERRFLAVGKDDYGDLKHIIVHSPSYTSLYEGTRLVNNFLKNNLYIEDLIFMINLDTGCQNVFELYNANGSKNTTIEGTQSPSQAANLLVYYYE